MLSIKIFKNLSTGSFPEAGTGTYNFTNNTGSFEPSFRYNQGSITITNTFSYPILILIGGNGNTCSIAPFGTLQRVIQPNGEEYFSHSGINSGCTYAIGWEPATTTPTPSITATKTLTPTPTPSITTTNTVTPTVTPTNGIRYHKANLPDMVNFNCVDECRILSFSGIALDRIVVLNWTISDYCRALVKNYRVEYKESNSSSWIFSSIFNKEINSANVINLINGTSYDFRLSLIRTDNSVSSSYCTVNLVPVPTQTRTPTGTPTPTPTPTTTVTPTKTSTPTPTPTFCPEIFICDGIIDDHLIDGGIIIELQVSKNPQCCCDIQLSLDNNNIWSGLPNNLIDCSPSLGYSLHPTCFGDIIP